jgi:hypothetical protein
MARIWKASGPARNFVKMTLLTNDAEKKLWKIREDCGTAIGIGQSTEMSDKFQEFFNLVYNMSLIVENVGEMSQFTNKIATRELLKKLPEYLRLQ